MPRLKSSRRSQASKLRVAGTRVGHQQPGSARFAPAGGTGGRHRVQKWPISSLTGRQHKLVVPPESPDKEFVLLVGASHLRSIVDGIGEDAKGKVFLWCHVHTGRMRNPAAYRGSQCCAASYTRCSLCDGSQQQPDIQQDHH
ncbi:hypothetical protein KUCAC02_005928 [Chaenocephalus aceratus]|uniref:Uncharacterized protein n=1 Tax=Chaenocephalus aceratus TaxID=36190 RepID=A0ACB9WQC2_CHAAC|nr:hypothetical protein KUCAC02_005928 [Chaenocephalus aceratus]